jgi:hypothetical protein
VNLNNIYNLSDDPDGYWVLYDLLLENNWADIYSFQISIQIPVRFSRGFYARCRSNVGIGRSRFVSFLGLDYGSRVGDQARSYVDNV